MRSCCNALAKPVPQEDANADKTVLHAFHRAAVDQLVTCTCGNPLNVVEDFDTKDES